MNDFVSSCRRTWRKLGVRKTDIDELTAEMEADIADAAADGVAAEVLVGHDPKSLARVWAVERGLSRPRLRLLTTVGAGVIAAIPGASFGLFAAYASTSSELVGTFGGEWLLNPPRWAILLLYGLSGVFAAAGTTLVVRAVLGFYEDLALGQTMWLLARTVVACVGAAVAATMLFASFREYGTDRFTVIGDVVVATTTYAIALGLVRVVAVLRTRRKSISGDSGAPTDLIAASI